MLEQMKEKTYYFNYLINFMQKRMKAKINTIYSKVAVIDSAWEQMYFKLLQKATELKDNGMK